MQEQPALETYEVEKWPQSWAGPIGRAEHCVPPARRLPAGISVDVGPIVSEWRKRHREFPSALFAKPRRALEDPSAQKRQ